MKLEPWAYRERVDAINASRLQSGFSYMHQSDDSYESRDPEYTMLGDVRVGRHKRKGEHAARGEIEEATLVSREMRAIRKMIKDGKIPDAQIPYAQITSLLKEDVNPLGLLGNVLPS